MRPNRTCLQCGDAFSCPEAWIRRGGGKYCGKDCARIGQRRPRVDLATHFWTRLDRNGPIHPHHPELGPCWIFIGARHSAEFPYGEIGVGGRPRGTHRVAWELTNGTIPLNLCVCHSCDNPPCCNPAHLFLDTDAGNALDKVKKGRAPTKVTAADVVGIRARHAAGERQTALAAEFGLSRNMLYLIVNRKAWKHL